MRYVMHASGQLPQRGPLMWMMSLHLHQKSDYDDDMNEVNKLRVGQFRDMSVAVADIQ